MGPWAKTRLAALLACLVCVTGAWAGPVDVELDRAPVADVLRLLAAAGGVSLIVDESVSGELTLSLRGMEALDAIELIASMRGLSLERVGQALLVSRAPLTLVGRVPAEESQALIFTQTPVSEIVARLAERAGWNLVIDVPLDRQITAWVEGMPYVDALRVVADAAGLRYHLVDRVLRIQGYVETQSPLATAIYRLDHVSPSAATQYLTAYVEGVQAQADTASRSVIVRGTAQALARVEEFLRAFDTAKPQVLVEARILEVATDALRDLGAEWSQWPAFTGATSSPGAVAMNWDVTQLQAVLRTLAEQGRSRVLASPRISSVDGEQARMLIGDRVPIVTESVDSEGRVSESVEFLEVGILLEIVPTIAADDSVTLQIRTEVSSVADPTARFPNVRTREAATRVRVQNGRPLVIGGLIQDAERERMRGLPLLSNFPLLGSLFGRRVTETEQTEMVIILIPHIVREEGVDAVADTGVGSAGALSGAVTADPGSPEWHAEAESRLAATYGHRGHDDVVAADLTLASDEAIEVHLERQSHFGGMYTRLYGSWSVDDPALGIGAGFRLYAGGPDRPVRPWLEVGGEYLTRQASDIEATLLSGGVGLQLNFTDRVLLDVYASAHRSSQDLAWHLIPGRSATQVGVRLGWRY